MKPADKINTAPLKLKIVVDENEIEFVDQVRNSQTFTYKFTKSITKLGMVMNISENDLCKNIEKGIFKIM